MSLPPRRPLRTAPAVVTGGGATPRRLRPRVRGDAPRRRHALARLEEVELAAARLLLERHRILAREAGIAEALPAPAGEAEQPLEAQVGERVRAEIAADRFYVVGQIGRASC